MERNFLTRNLFYGLFLIPILTFCVSGKTDNIDVNVLYASYAQNIKSFGSEASEMIQTPLPSKEKNKDMNMKWTPVGRNIIFAQVGDNTLEIKLENNSSAQAFKELLAKGPLTVKIHDYNQFEKVGDLGTILPQNDESITTEPGDVILYQGNSITIYYDINRWNFTRLGRIQNLTKDKLKAALGKKDVIVTFKLTLE